MNTKTALIMSGEYHKEHATWDGRILRFSPPPRAPPYDKVEGRHPKAPFVSVSVIHTGMLSLLLSCHTKVMYFPVSVYEVDVLVQSSSCVS